MSETRKNSWVAKRTVTTTEGAMTIDGAAEARGRSDVAIIVNPTIQTEDHTITITNS
jgi:hypothetical protein